VKHNNQSLTQKNDIIFSNNGPLKSGISICVNKNHHLYVRDGAPYSRTASRRYYCAFGKVGLTYELLCSVRRFLFFAISCRTISRIKSPDADGISLVHNCPSVFLFCLTAAIAPDLPGGPDSFQASFFA